MVEVSNPLYDEIEDRYDLMDLFLPPYGISFSDMSFCLIFARLRPGPLSRHRLFPQLLPFPLKHRLVDCMGEIPPHKKISVCSP